jgi:hypothetical protein
MKSKENYPDTSCEDALVPPPHLILKCHHNEEAHVKQSRHPTTVSRAYYFCPYKSVSIIFHLELDYFDFQTFLNVIQRSLTFAERRLLQFLSVDRWTRDVEHTNSSFPV